MHNIGMRQQPYIFSVNEITRYIKTTIERERTLQGVLVRGEISNCKYHSSGHLYFTLKDNASQLPCVMWHERVVDLPFLCENGMRVTAEGSIAVYERGGYYQLSVYSMKTDGVGDLFIAFEQLKRKLEAEGIFDQSRKRPLPAIPRRIALLTSPTGAVLHDFITVSARRWHGRHITLIPTVVQGPFAPGSIVHSLEVASQIPGVDVIVLARGGGSFEELAAFNDEAVVRAVARSPIPVVSAVGHETDFTIADFVADLRAPTPSAAAEVVVPDINGVERYLTDTEERIFSRVSSRIHNERRHFERLASHPVLRNPRVLLQDHRQAVDLTSDRILERMRARLHEAKASLDTVEARITALDPRGVLLRGYALVYNQKDNQLITSTNGVTVNDQLRVQFFDGEVGVSVTE